MQRAGSAPALAAAAVAVAVCLGVVLLGFAHSSLKESGRFLENAWPVKGEVVTLEPMGDDLSRSVPVIRFTTIQGDRIVMQFPEADLSPGDSVNLLYDGDHSATVRLNDYWSLWFESWAFGAAGVLLVVIPAAAWLRERFRRTD